MFFLINVIYLLTDIFSNPVQLRGVNYCTAIAQGNVSRWDFVYQRFLASNVASEQAILLGALGCSKEIWVLNRYLKMSLDPESGFRKQHTTSIFYHVAYNIIGRDLAFDFARNNWDKITD